MFIKDFVLGINILHETDQYNDTYVVNVGAGT